MSYHFIEKKDPHVEILFQGLENLERMLSDMEKTPKPMFKGERFLTDEELSGILRISRRTLQEYRTLGVIPYYLLQGKVLYKESDIQRTEVGISVRQENGEKGRAAASPFFIIIRHAAPVSAFSLQALPHKGMFPG